jgi:hypothetical protein
LPTKHHAARGYSTCHLRFDRLSNVDTASPAETLYFDGCLTPIKAKILDLIDFSLLCARKVFRCRDQLGTRQFVYFSEACSSLKTTPRRRTRAIFDAYDRTRFIGTNQYKNNVLGSTVTSFRYCELVVNSAFRRNEVGQARVEDQGPFHSFCIDVGATLR